MVQASAVTVAANAPFPRKAIPMRRYLSRRRHRLPKMPPSHQFNSRRKRESADRIQHASTVFGAVRCSPSRRQSAASAESREASPRDHCPSPFALRRCAVSARPGLHDNSGRRLSNPVRRATPKCFHVELRIQRLREARQFRQRLIQRQPIRIGRHNSQNPNASSNLNGSSLAAANGLGAFAIASADFSRHVTTPEALVSPQTSADNTATTAAQRPTSAALLTAQQPALPSSLPTSLNDVVQASRLYQRVGGAEMHIAMDTDLLGWIDLRAVIHQSGLTATIGVQHADVQALLSSATGGRRPANEP